MLKQCYLPEGAVRFDNPVGSADPFVLQMGTTTVIAVPGVPREFFAIVDLLILPRIAEKAAMLGSRLEALQVRNYRILSLSESQVAEYLKQANLPPSVEVLIRADFPEIQVVLRAPVTATDLEKNAVSFESVLPKEAVFDTSLDSTFEAVVVDVLKQSKKTVATAESCTGGLIASMLTKVPGSSAIFKGSIVAYANEIKTGVLGVDSGILVRHGAVSAECAKAMAELVRERCGADIGISVTGIAGPDGGSAEKPIGTVFIGLALADTTKVYKIFFPDTRERIQQYTAFAALDELRRNLLDLPARFAAVAV